MVTFALCAIALAVMYIQKLSVLNFKSIRQLDLEFTPKINCFVGNNGQGKTNLIDAIYYLSMCKSAFNPNDNQVLTHGEQYFMLQGTYSRRNSEERISCGFKLNSGKVFKRNDNEYSRLAEHIGLLPVVMVSPADIALIADSGDERRRYMNSVIAQYDRLYLDEVLRYNRALSQRNTLLKSGAFSADLLEAIDVQLATYGQRIYDKRSYFIDQLIPIFRQHYARVSGREENVSLQYRSHLHQAPPDELLRLSLDKDRVLQHTSVGVHRDDMQLTLNGFPIRREGSQGQQKTYLIALKLAQLEFMARVAELKPILLLDDIFDKLDADRVQHLISLVADEEFGQIFITDTNPFRLRDAMQPSGLTYSLFHINNGAVEEHPA